MEKENIKLLETVSKDLRNLINEMYSVVDEVYISQINVLKTDYYKMLLNKHNLYLPFEHGDEKFAAYAFFTFNP